MLRVDCLIDLKEEMQVRFLKVLRTQIKCVLNFQRHLDQKTPLFDSCVTSTNKLADKVTLLLLFIITNKETFYVHGR